MRKRIYEHKKIKNLSEVKVGDLVYIDDTAESIEITKNEVGLNSHMMYLFGTYQKVEYLDHRYICIGVIEYIFPIKICEKAEFSSKHLYKSKNRNDYD